MIIPAYMPYAIFSPNFLLTQVFDDAGRACLEYRVALQTSLDQEERKVHPPNAHAHTLTWLTLTRTLAQILTLILALTLRLRR